METIKEEKKILVKYLREKDTYVAKLCKDKNGIPFAHLEKSKGKIIGCIIATDKSSIGWSLINKLDRPWIDNPDNWDKLDWKSYTVKQQQESLNKIKELSYHIAYNRALFSETLNSNELKNYYSSKIPDSISEEINKMLERSEKYFSK